MDSYFDRSAAVGDDDEEEEFDEDTGQVVEGKRKSRATNGDIDDSSEEEDDDEEEERRIREGFIVEDEEDDEAAKERRRERKKRRREEREEDENLDDEDLDLIGETHPGMDRRQASQSKFKRLKRGHREDRTERETRAIEDIFSDEEDGADGVGTARDRDRGAFGYNDDLDDFIEQDEDPDGDGQIDEDIGVRAPKRPGFADLQNLKDAGLSQDDMEFMREVFGEGHEFQWALDVEADNNEDQIDPDKPLELKDVFEPSQLIEKLLTDDDNLIRMTDVPERFQLARKPYKDLTDMSDAEMAGRAAEEAKWVSNLLFPKKGMPGRLRQPFEAAVMKTLRFMNVEDYEPPFIFTNRRDYLIHSEQTPNSPGGNGVDYDVKAEKLLNQTDLWDIFETDLKFRAFEERRQVIRRSVQTLKETIPDFNDAVFDDLLPQAEAMDDLQDLQEYLNFQYSEQLKEAATVDAEANGLQKRARGARSIFDKVRQGPAYHLVRAFGITADQLAINTDKSGRRTYTDDPSMRPDDMADSLVRDPDYKTGQDVIHAARAMFVEEIVVSPRLRRYLRQIYYTSVVFDVHRTEKGLKQINEEHPYYEFKYLRNQRIEELLLDRPHIFLLMLKAESEGLVEIRLRLQGEKRIREDLVKAIESDNFSEVADAWNVFRREALDVAITKLHRVISKGVKDNVKNECENKIAGQCRDAYTGKLDQAPLKPKGMQPGTTPRVLALTNGLGNRDDAICWAYLDEGGRVLENGKFGELKLGDLDRTIPTYDTQDVGIFVELVQRRNPDFVAVSGMSVEAKRLYKMIQEIITKHRLMGTPFTDDDDREAQDELEVVMVNDEVARPYHTSERAAKEHPGVPPLTRYCIALGRFIQSPLKEYAALGRDILSISFDPHQILIPEEKLLKYLETSMVDMVNLTGVEINDAVSDSYTANLLPYVSGLGPRKAAHVLKVINQNGGDITTRDELVGDVDRGKKQAVGPKVWTNCASFLYITYDEGDPSCDYLDNTRIHPEDYDIARKMSADALEMDEEDIKAEVDENGMNAIVRKLIKEDSQDRVNDLMLEQYAEQLQRQFQQLKRATLETIRVELQNPFEELRPPYDFMSSNEIFTMLTGETRDSLAEGMIIPVSVKRVFQDRIEVKLDSGIEGSIFLSEFPEDFDPTRGDPKDIWAPHQVVRAKLIKLERKFFSTQLSLRNDALRDGYHRELSHGQDEWDKELEARDKKEAEKITNAGQARAQRVIKHPLFRPFNSRQAEDFLMGQGRGDCVIRPSSKGPDHLAVTWKIHDALYQHIDVLELSKENEFSVGRILKIGGKYTYSDLDELIALHVNAMAKKVDEMMGDERYQSGSRQQTGEHHQHLRTSHLLTTFYRTMAYNLHRSEPQALHICVLPQLQASRLLRSVLQSRTDRAVEPLAGQGDSECV